MVDCRILQVMCHGVRLSPDLNLDHLAQMTPGFVGVDLRFLVTKAGQICIKRFGVLFMLDGRSSPLACHCCRLSF